MSYSDIVWSELVNFKSVWCAWNAALRLKPHRFDLSWIFLWTCLYTVIMLRANRTSGDWTSPCMHVLTTDSCQYAFNISDACWLVITLGVQLCVQRDMAIGREATSRGPSASAGPCIGTYFNSCVLMRCLFIQNHPYLWNLSSKN